MTDVHWDGRASDKWDQDNWNDGAGTPLTGLDWTVGDLRPHWLGTGWPNSCDDFNAAPDNVDLALGFKVDAAYGAAHAANLDWTLSLVGNVIGGVVDIASYTPNDDGQAWELTSLILRGGAGLSFDAALHTIPIIQIYGDNGAIYDVAGNNVNRDVYLMDFDANIEIDFASTNDYIFHIHYSAQDEVQPDVSDVRAGIEFGVEGHTKMGTLPAPDPDSGDEETRGQDCKLYRNAGTYEEPSWVEVSLVRDLTLDLERNEHDATTRGSGDFEAVSAGLLKAPANFDMLWITGNASFQALFGAFMNNTLIEMAVMDGSMTTPGRTGLRGQMRVLKFTEGQPKDGNVTASVTFKPGVGDNAPEWHTVPEA